MLHLVALSCYQCPGPDGARDSKLFDTTHRRPITGSCSHSACAKCVQLNPDMRCRICHVENAFKNQSVNYAAVEIIKDYQKNCIDVYRNWWDGKIQDCCPNCKESATSLRICVECHAKIFYEKDPEPRIYLKDPQGSEKFAKFLWCSQCYHRGSDNECHHGWRKSEYIFAMKNFDMNLVQPESLSTLFTCPNCLEKNIDLYFCLECTESLIRKESNELYVDLFDSESIYRVSNVLRCSDCIADNDNPCHSPKHFQNVKRLNNFESQIKKWTARIVRDLLLEQLEKWAELGTCQLQYMRMARICEVLNSLAVFFYPQTPPDYVKDYFEGLMDGYILHLSQVSKFFSPMEWEVFLSKRMGIDTSEFKDLPLKLLDTLEFQLSEYQKTPRAPCECSILWKKLQEGRVLKNQIELQYASIIEKIPLTDHFEACPAKKGRGLQDLEELEESLQMKFPFKTHLLPMAFCWHQYRGGFCDAFDNESRKPCICEKCKISTCLKCINSNFNIKCPFCRVKYHPYKFTYFYNPETGNLADMQRDRKYLKKIHREYEHDEKIMELAEFYKENAVKVYEEWWKSQNIGGYCMKCQSYSSQLEICVLCEMAHPEGAIRNNGKRLEFYAPSSTSRISTRLQCSNCAIRLKSSLEQENSTTPYEVRHLESPVEMFRGCNHKSRVNNGCWKYDKVWVKDEKFTQSVMRVSDIQNSPLMLKWADWNVVHRILRARIDEQFENKEELMNVVEDLESRTRKYLVEALNGSVVDDTLKGEIDNLICKMKMNL